MHTVSEAVAELRSASRLLVAAQSTPLAECTGRVLAQDITAPIDVPPADNSAMDGYAFRYADWAGPGQPLPLSQRIVAGIAPPALAPGTAARIFTGAEIPPGADTVVMQEYCTADSSSVLIQESPAIGANIRRRAQDIERGQCVLEAGQRIRPQDAGLIASLGIAQIQCYRRLKVAVMSNGSELVEPGDAVQPGQIYNSNRYLLSALMKAWGFEVLDLGIVSDDPQEIRERLIEAGRNADVIISSGGVSVGEEDHIRDVVDSLGGIDLWKVSIKPGKPFAFGNVHGTPFLGLPGNPSSVLVTCLVIARPFLFACQGIASSEVYPLRKAALFDHKGSPRTEYLRVRSTGAGLECYPRQSSDILLSTVWGDGLAVQHAGQDIRQGDELDFLPYALLL